MKKELLLISLLFSTIIFSQNYQFLGSYTSNGTPLYLAENDNVSVQTLELIDQSLPESYPVPDYNPHYISSGYDTDVLLEEDAEIWVTFVSEGAGYKNVLGFYTYPINSPSTEAPNPDEITIIFPNVSALGSGGGLQTGNKVKIGTFTSGTGIGWVLLANGWSGGNVTSGNWQLFSNPDYNPESDSNLRYHNVLLTDPDNQRIILGFEDIRRDYSSCDNDFNDAVFYVTANPYTALKTVNYADINSATEVTSANNGGLESNGKLASLIATRNFNRVKTNSFSNKKQNQSKITTKNNTFKKTNGAYNLDKFLPKTGMYGTEIPYLSSPTDLKEITNAQEIFSADYYQENNRVSAALITQTTREIYDHSKVICDRLNNSSLEDVRIVKLNDHEIIMIEMIRNNGLKEYALSFSVELLDSKNTLHSYWDINQYPKGDYLNFQIWGNSMGQVSTISNYILDKLIEIKPLQSEKINNKIPTVFVKKGFYKNGELHLRIINKDKETTVNFEGYKRNTELSLEEYTSKNIYLNGNYEEDVIIEIGNLFDIGFSFKGNNSSQQDALYLADGPWGIDYLEEETTIEIFEINNDSEVNFDESYRIERNPYVKGEVFGTMNLYRNLLPGELIFDTSNYTKVEFTIQNSLPIEVILVTENLLDWNNRLRFQLPVNSKEAKTTISLEDFKDANGLTADYSNIKSLVFSVKGNYSNYQKFDLSVKNVSFRNNNMLNDNELELITTTKLFSYPNPATNYTTLVLPKKADNAQIVIIDALGHIVYQNTHKVSSLKNEITLPISNLSGGVYKFVVIANKNEKMQTNIIIN
jgi:hypothetical protein